LHKTKQSPATVVALDILPIAEMDGVTIITGDFTESQALDDLVQVLCGEQVDLVLSDMAPNISGNKAVDQPKSMYLCELALDFANHHLKLNGSFVVKLFQGVGYPPYIADLKSKFKQVSMVKPRASRKESSEMYAVARGFGL
jgi:23S rRNA (uridine2552-2'-O)-methyltransferase